MHLHVIIFTAEIIQNYGSSLFALFFVGSLVEKSLAAVKTLLQSVAIWNSINQTFEFTAARTGVVCQRRSMVYDL